MSYYRVDLTTALLYSAWTLPLMVIAQHLASHKSEYEFEIAGEIRSLLFLTTCIHAFAWIAQFYGHGLHEGRVPALVDNLGFALLAPFFVTFEFLHYGFGYREGPEMKEVRAAIANEIKAYRESRR